MASCVQNVFHALLRSALGGMKPGEPVSPIKGVREWTISFLCHLSRFFHGDDVFGVIPASKVTLGRQKLWRKGSSAPLFPLLHACAIAAA
jgi:hypothetical protein